MATDKTADDNIHGNTKKTDSENKNDDSITLSKHTFYKLAIIGMVGLIAASFFIGYTLHSTIYPPTLITNPSIPSAEVATPPVPVTVTNISIGNAPSLGSEQAKVTVVEFSDFQCPFCSSFFSNTLPQIKTEYVDTGKIKFVYKHYPLDFHQNAKIASVASECAKEEGKFWDYHDILLANQTAWEMLAGNDTTNTFVSYAENLGLDSDKFRSCLEIMKYERKVDMDLEQGFSIGVTGTPAFFVGIEDKEFILIEGAQPFTSFKQAIDELL